MSWLDDGDRYLVVTVPKGIDQQDIQGVMNGFSAAAGKPRVSLASLPSAYGTVRGMLLVPMNQIFEIEGGKAFDAQSNARISLRGLTGAQYGAIMDSISQKGSQG